jgi:hypothetical protein
LFLQAPIFGSDIALQHAISPTGAGSMGFMMKALREASKQSHRK